MRPKLVLVASALGFALLVALVSAGVFTRADRYAVLHLMPWLEPSSSSQLIRPRTALLPDTRSTLGGTLVALWTYPASPLISGLLVAVCAYVLERRGRRHLAVAVIALWVGANAVELIAKAAIARPSVGVSAYRHSFPSGHTVRACIVAAVVAWTWRRAGRAAAAWALTIPFALVALGDHTPTDVVGGLLLSAFLIAAAQAALPALNRRSDSKE